MMKGIRNSSLLVLMLALTLAFASGCKSKKKAAEAARAAEERARMEQAALDKEKEEERKRKEAEENARKEEEARKMAEAPKAKLTRYFESIATSGNVTAANGSINEALTLFASPETPVLIVISEENGQKDYDRPTTIRDYLNYLKDQRKNINTISNLQFDASGKITEVELRKK